MVGQFYINGLGLHYGESGLHDFSRSQASGGSGEMFPAVRPLKEALPGVNLRRVSSAGRLALGAAAQALAGGGQSCPLDAEAAPTTGLYVGSAFGAADSSFAFMDSVLEGGAQLASPTHFSHSVNNAFCGFLSMNLNIQGPSSTVCQFGLSFAGAVQIALGALAGGEISQALVGAVEQACPQMDLVQKNAVAVPGFTPAPARDCAVFFLISARPTHSDGPGRVCLRLPEWGGAFLPAADLPPSYAGHPAEQALDLAAALLRLSAPACREQSLGCVHTDSGRGLSVRLSLEKRPR